MSLANSQPHNGVLPVVKGFNSENVERMVNMMKNNVLKNETILTSKPCGDGCLL